MSRNPYLAPQARVDDVVPSHQVPDGILRKIRNGWVAGIVSGVMALLAMSGHPILSFNAWSLFDVALIFGLAFGIYRKSRVCATSMLVYFVASKILIYAQAGFATGGFVIPVMLCYCYALGVQGTFQYHRWLAAHVVAGR